MKISVIGSGALGKLYGGLLALSGHDVHFLLRSEYQATLEKAGFSLNLLEHTTSLTINQPQIYSDPQKLPKSELVIISVKTTANHQLKALLSQAVGPKTIIWIIQNGIGNEELLLQDYPNHPLLSCISTVCASRNANQDVDIPALGELRVASVNEEGKTAANYIQSLFKTQIQPKIVSYDDYKKMRWQKLVWNVPFCSLSIIYNETSDVLAQNKPYQHIVQQMMKEVQAIAQSEQIEISDEYLQKTFEITKKIKNYYPSMYYDFRNKKPIEKEFILTNVLKIADQNDIPAPCIHLATKSLDNQINY